ncbi:hypothetical protein CR513_37860, partial [Mucuna pruriens]
MTGRAPMHKRTLGPNTKMSQTKEKWQFLEERLRAMEGGNRYGLEAIDLCLVSDVGLPADFKTPKFDKCKGSSCPRVHLDMYYRKMIAHIYNDKILIHCFQDSLTGATLSWDLAEAFLKQYKYNEDMAPDRSRLQNMIKKEQEGFKECAQRWRKLAVQVQPSITEREMVTMFIDTLPSPYFDKVMGNVASNFTDLVMVGERIELGIRRRQFAQLCSNVGLAKKPMPEKKKGETNTVGKVVPPHFPLQPMLAHCRRRMSLLINREPTSEQLPIQDQHNKAREGYPEH